MNLARSPGVSGSASPAAKETAIIPNHMTRHLTPKLRLVGDYVMFGQQWSCV
jgi:hypothetical protein